MIKLFESTATAFDSNGIGFMSDAISCKVIEERNGSFELEMVYPIHGIRYSEILTRRILVARPNPFDDPQPFRIYEITKPINGKVSVYAEHISYDLAGIPVRPFSAQNVQTALSGLKTNAMINCPFTFTTDKTTAANYGFLTPTNIRSELGGVEGSILDTYRGEYKFDRYLVKLLNNRGIDRGVTIRYRKNLTDLEQDENIANLYTGVVPYWYSDLENGGLVQGTIVNAPGTYNFQKILVLDCSYDFQEKPTVDQLTQFATAYINSNNVGIPKVSISVSFINLADSEEYEGLMNLTTVHLCDTVTVEYPELGVKASGKCIKTDYDVLENRYNSVVIGDAKPNLASTLTSNNDKLAEEFEKKLLSTTATTREEFANNLDTKYNELTGEIQILDQNTAKADADLKKLIQDTAEKEAEEREAAIKYSTEKITGNLGGYVLLHSSTNADYPDEILVMDSQKVETAKKIWRWNKSGLGYSNAGYAGPYGLAITQDGVIVADYIQAGAINASLITTGHMSASIIQGGTLILGGASNGNGVFILRDNSNNTIGLMNNGGISIYKGTINGPSIVVGGSGNSHGSISVLAADGSLDGSWDINGIYIRKSKVRILTNMPLDSSGNRAEVMGEFLGQEWNIYNGTTLVNSFQPMTYKGVLVGYTWTTRLPELALSYEKTSGVISTFFSYKNNENVDTGDEFDEKMVFFIPNGKAIRMAASEVRFGYSTATGPAHNEPVTMKIVNLGDLCVISGDTSFKYTENGSYSPVNASAFNISSSIRNKTDIHMLEEYEAKKILDLKLITFSYTADEKHENYAGVIAEQLYGIYPSLVSLNENDFPEAVDYSKFAPYLIKMVQILWNKVEMQQEQINSLLEKQ